MLLHLLETDDLSGEVLKWLPTVAVCHPLLFMALANIALVCKASQRAVAKFLTAKRHELLARMRELHGSIERRLAAPRAEAAEASRLARGHFVSLILDDDAHLEVSEAAHKKATARIEKAMKTIADFESKYTYVCVHHPQTMRPFESWALSPDGLPAAGLTQAHAQQLGVEVECAAIRMVMALTALRCDPDRASWVLTAAQNGTEYPFASNTSLLATLQNDCDACGGRCTAADLSRSRLFATCRLCMKGPHGMVRMRVRRPRTRGSEADPNLRATVIGARKAGDECGKNAIALLKRHDKKPMPQFSDTIGALLARSGRAITPSGETPVVALRLRALPNHSSNEGTLVGALGYDCPRLRAQAVAELEEERRVAQLEAAARQRAADRAQAHMKVMGPLFARLRDCAASRDSPLGAYTDLLFQSGCDPRWCDVPYLGRLMRLSRSGAIVAAAAMAIPEISADVLRAQRARVSLFMDRVTTACFWRVDAVRRQGGLPLFITIAAAFPALEAAQLPVGTLLAIARADMRLVRPPDRPADAKAVAVRVTGDGWHGSFDLHARHGMGDLLALGRIVKPHTWATTSATTLMATINEVLAEAPPNDPLTCALKQCVYGRYRPECAALYALVDGAPGAPKPGA